MYTQEEYLYGWAFYLLGVLMVMVCGWLWTARLRYGGLRMVLRSLVAVFLVAPWYASPDLDSLAPAWIIAVFEGIFEGGDAFWRAGLPLVAALSATLVLTLVVQLTIALMRKTPTESPAE